jgi:hypothetical protein
MTSRHLSTTSCTILRPSQYSQNVYTRLMPNPTPPPRFTNSLAIQVAIKDGKETEAYTENLSKEIEFVNEHGNHPVLSQCVFVPFGRGTSIDPPTFCSLIRMQNEFLHYIQHIKIHGLADIDIDRHLGNDIDDGEDISNSICEIFLKASDDSGERLFHSIKHTMK